MNTRGDFLRQANRRYPEFLRSLLTGGAFFPLPLRLGKASRAENYEERRSELDRLRLDAAALGFEVEWETVEERRFGRHERPVRAFFAEEERYLKALGKAGEAARFREESKRVLARFPEWRDWIDGNVKVFLQELGNWERMIEVVAWLRTNPSSALYLRQIPVYGVDTKLVERRTRVLDELLSLPGAATPGDFRSKYGLRSEEHLLRLRFLDDRWRERCGFPAGIDEVALPSGTVARLPLVGCTAVMTENLRNFLALPRHHATVGLFGSGDALSHWRSVGWLRKSACHYWGDLDLHGFAMLSRLRGFLPESCSLMMDLATFERHRDLAGPDNTSMPSIDRDALTPAELQMLALLEDERVRLEQERIPIQYVASELATL